MPDVDELVQRYDDIHGELPRTPFRGPGHPDGGVTESICPVLAFRRMMSA
jgi:hypothetical protein